MKIPPYINFNDLLDIRVGDDELFYSGAGDSWIKTIDSLKEWEEKSVALKELFKQTLGTPKGNINCSLSPEVAEEECFEGYIRRTVSYNLEPDERIEAYVLIPDDTTEKLPAMLCLTPTTNIGKEQTVGNGLAEKDHDRAYALHLVKHGFVTISFDWDASGKRKYPGLRHFDNGPFYQKHPQWSGVGKNNWDIKCALDYLCSMPEVDSERIGSIGHSQGGGATVMAMALDDRIKLGVSSCGGLPLRLNKNPFDHARDRWWIGRPALRPYCLTGKQFPVDLHELIALCAPRPFLHIAALNDTAYSFDKEKIASALKNMSENIRKVYNLFGKEDQFDNCLHNNGHNFFEEQRKYAYTFINRFL